MSLRTSLREHAAKILQNHFDTEASDAGLRSLDLAGVGSSGSRSYDASAVARADKGHARQHAKVRAALTKLDAKHVELLSLAYGCRFRSRDVEDSKRRKAIPQHERNWRVRLAEDYGTEAAMVMASPLAQRLYQDETAQTSEEGFVTWLLGSGHKHRDTIATDATNRLNVALDAFAAVYGLQQADSAPRTRSSEKTRSRILASYPEHGQEIA